MSSRATSRSRRRRTRNRSPRRQSGTQRLSPPATGAADRTSRPRRTAAGADRPTWERELNRLRRVSVVLAVVLVTVLARMMLDGPTLLNGLTAALILALLLASLGLLQQGRRLRRSRGPDRSATNDRQPNQEL